MSLPPLDPALGTLLVGILCLSLSCMCGVVQISGGPNAPNYPRIPWSERTALFICSAFMLGRGIDLLLWLKDGRPTDIGWWGLGACLALTGYFGMRVIDTLRSRLPPTFWENVQKAKFLAHCVNPFDRESIREARGRARGNRHGAGAQSYPGG